MQSKLDVIIGCMFSGKSTELIKRIRTAKVLFENNLMVINHKSDNRYCEKSYICSHDKDKITAIQVHSLNHLLYSVEFSESKAIFIDEAQFFDDLYEFVMEALKYDKWIVVCGLDGDFQGAPFGEILRLIPVSDSICKLTALCTQCKDGTPAIFSKRKVNAIKKVMIGSTDSYEPVCRKHFNQKNHLD